ncbi:sodium/nucleoside cotransporter 1-like [Haemaphysalis longicornis]
MGPARKSKGKGRAGRQDTQLATANKNAKPRKKHRTKSPRRASSKMATSSAAHVVPSAVTGDALADPPSGTPATVASENCFGFIQTRDAMAVQNTGPTHPTISTAAQATSPPGKHASRWATTTSEPYHRPSPGTDKPDLRQASGFQAPPSTSTHQAEDTQAAEVAEPNKGGSVPHEVAAKPPLGLSLLPGFLDQLRGGYERDATSSTRQPSEFSSKSTDQPPSPGIPKPTGPAGPEAPSSDTVQRLLSALGWAALAAAHVYTGWLAWRFWAVHEPLSLAGDRCPDTGLLVAMLVATHSYTALLVLRKTGLWEPLVDTLAAAAKLTGGAIKGCSCIKPASTLPVPAFSELAGCLIQLLTFVADMGPTTAHRRVLWTACFAALLARATLNSSAAMEGPICAAGQLVLLAGCCAYSRYPKSIRWTIPMSALLAHYLLALLFVHLGAGHELLACTKPLIARLMSFSQDGALSTLGYLSTGEIVGLDEAAPVGVAYIVLPGVLFAGTVAILLFCCGLTPFIIANTGWVAHHVLGITSCEAIVALANVFFGMGEAPLLVVPYLERMTRSELHCLMSTGFATISAALLPALQHLNLSLVDVMISPLLSTLAAIASSKLLYPETEDSATAQKNLEEYKSPNETSVEALATRMVTLVAIVPAIGYTLVAFHTAAAFVNDVFAGLGRLVSVAEFTPHAILTTLLEPMVLLMGVGLDEVHFGARLLATELLSSEVVAYRDLTSHVGNGALSMRTRRVITFALCGFANVSSLGVAFGVISTIAPNRSTDLASIGFSALVAGCVANYLTACTIGTIITATANPVLGRFNATDFLHG